MTGEPDAASNALMLTVLRDLRREQRENRDLLIKLAETVIRTGAKIDALEARLIQKMQDQRDELELIIKSEIMGRLHHIEDIIDLKIKEASQQA